MARRKRQSMAGGGGAEDDVNLTPMLDVVFILLIFFIVTAQFIKEPGVDIVRPEVETRQSPSHLRFWLRSMLKARSTSTRRKSRQMRCPLR